MSRYFSQAKGKTRASDDEDWWDPGPLILDLTVSDHQAIDTGLLDAAGNPIMKAPNPMGFHRWS